LPLKTGLTEPETRELFTTRDVATAVRLVWHGLKNQRRCWFSRQSQTHGCTMSDKSTPTPAPTADQSAAHEFLCELRTRITTQPLPYQHGVEARALESLYEVFGHSRAAMKKYPGCERFAAAVTDMLNVELRPVTAKWHRAHEEGRLNARDGADEFRGDLQRCKAA
jgi:hypothetical protein